MSFDEAQQYCQWAEKRLPTEQEWVYAASANTLEDLTAEDLQQYAWSQQDEVWEAQPVGTKEPNAWGLFDMFGNVAEWTTDQVSETQDYPLHVIKGGAWGGEFGQGSPEALQLNARQTAAEWVRSFAIGFRCVRDANKAFVNDLKT